MSKLIRFCGVALLIAGLGTCLINIVLTPLMAQHTSANTAASAIFLVRGAASGIVALLLLFGCIGVYAAQARRSALFEMFAFIVALTGTALLFAVEWSNVFLLRAIAQASPSSQVAVDHNTLANVGYGSAAGIFAVGWILLSASILRTGILPRWPAIAIVAGFFLIPILQGVLGMSGAIIGNVVLGAGLASIGYAIFRNPDAHV